MYTCKPYTCYPCLGSTDLALGLTPSLAALLVTCGLCPQFLVKPIFVSRVEYSWPELPEMLNSLVDLAVGEQTSGS